jgi:hypothetical protein
LIRLVYFVSFLLVSIIFYAAPPLLYFLNFYNERHILEKAKRFLVERHKQRWLQWFLLNFIFKMVLLLIAWVWMFGILILINRRIHWISSWLYWFILRCWQFQIFLCPSWNIGFMRVIILFWRKTWILYRFLLKMIILRTRCIRIFVE